MSWSEVEIDGLLVRFYSSPTLVNNVGKIRDFLRRVLSNVDDYVKNMLLRELGYIPIIYLGIAPLIPFNTNILPILERRSFRNEEKLINELKRRNILPIFYNCYSRNIEIRDTILYEASLIELSEENINLLNYVRDFLTSKIVRRLLATLLSLYDKARSREQLQVIFTRSLPAHYRTSEPTYIEKCIELSLGSSSIYYPIEEMIHNVNIFRTFPSKIIVEYVSFDKSISELDKNRKIILPYYIFKMIESKFSNEKLINIIEMLNNVEIERMRLMLILTTKPEIITTLKDENKRGSLCFKLHVSPEHVLPTSIKFETNRIMIPIVHVGEKHVSPSRSLSLLEKACVKIVNKLCLDSRIIKILFTLLRQGYASDINFLRQAQSLNILIRSRLGNYVLNVACSVNRTVLSLEGSDKELEYRFKTVIRSLLRSLEHVNKDVIIVLHGSNIEELESKVNSILERLNRISR